jgi:hypothetical protein
MLFQNRYSNKNREGNFLIKVNAKPNREKLLHIKIATSNKSRARNDPKHPKRC